MKMIKGALYVIAVEIEDLHQDTTDQDLIRGHQESNMRVLKGALSRLDMHGKEVKIVEPACRIMRYSITREDPKGRSATIRFGKGDES